MAYYTTTYDKRHQTSSAVKFGRLLVLAFLQSSHSWQLGQLFGRIKPPSVVDVLAPVSPIAEARKALLLAISNTKNGKDADLETQTRVLKLVKYLEDTVPPPTDLLEDPLASRELDGVWYLQYTAPSDIDVDDEIKWNPKNRDEGSSKIDTRKAYIQGAVRAGGLTVDTSSRVTTQTINVAEQRIENKVDQDFGMVTVGGSFRVSDAVKTRAVVAFDRANITLNNGLVLRLGFLFSLIATFRGGIKDNGWLETTYLDKEMRIGRGNKGSLFVLTRDKDAAQP